jgi:LAGLIDADG DNA endonuclease family
MDPIVLAYLIQSDRSYSSNRVRIYTNSFTKSEVELLAKSITIKFNIISGVTHDRNNQFIISIGASQLDLLINIVATHFHASMLYRIGL